MKKLKIILDVPLEDLKDILLDNGCDVCTVTEKLGPTPEDRADSNILTYAQETNSIVVTVDKPFVSRLRAAGVRVAALALEDKAKIIHEKLERFDLVDTNEPNLVDDKVLDDFNQIKSGEPSRMSQKG